MIKCEESSLTLHSRALKMSPHCDLGILLLKRFFREFQRRWYKIEESRMNGGVLE